MNIIKTLEELQGNYCVLVTIYLKIQAGKPADNSALPSKAKSSLRIGYHWGTWVAQFLSICLWLRS